MIMGYNKSCTIHCTEEQLDEYILKLEEQKSHVSQWTSNGERFITTHFDVANHILKNMFNLDNIHDDVNEFVVREIL